jgi:acetyl esterase/lipase
VLRLLTAVFGLFGRGRSPASLLNLTVPRSGYRIERDIPYGDERRQKLDLYVPDGFKAPAPAVLFFYGGGFIAGRKSEYRIVGQALTSQGIIVGIGDYGLYPEFRFPVFVQDGAKAFVAFRQLLPQYGGNPARAFVAGHSAGAYIAAMLAANPFYLKEAGGDPLSLRGAIGMAGAYDFLPITDPQRIEIFGGSNRAESQPINFVDGKRPPMLLASGDIDKAVSVRNTRNLAAKLRAQGSKVEEIVYPRLGHSGIMLALAPGFRRLAPIRADMVRFIKSN